MRSIDINQIKSLNERKGQYFFSASTTRFFRSRYPVSAYLSADGSKAYFVTSEQFVGSSGIPAPRKYTVRVCDMTTGDINTVGEFNNLSRYQAMAEIKKLVN